ncbi:MAG: transporter substrate-binding domain-containing protein [Rhodocyclaceae bacterium]|nr:transporter substrate-binding domain-containing protein [Rhodocyclaceae bacterium]
MGKRVAAPVLAVVIAALSLPATGADVLRACLAADNPPFSMQAGERHGIDHEVLAELAARLGRSLDTHWVTIPNRGGLGKALRQAFASPECEVFAGVPLAEGVNEDLQAQGVAASRAYWHTGYALVAGRGSRVRTLADARAADRVGAVSATPADLYLFEQHMQRRPFGSNQALLAALAAGQLDAALVWLPALARANEQGEALWPGAVRAGQLQAPQLRASYVLAFSRTSTLTPAAVDPLIADMEQAGRIEAIAAQYGLPPP